MQQLSAAPALGLSAALAVLKLKQTLNNRELLTRLEEQPKLSRR
jgi:hypothetical protein